MVRINPLLSLFIFLADITIALPRTTTSPKAKPLVSARKATTKTTKMPLWKPIKLPKFVEKLENECDFDGLDAVSKDLKDLWARTMNDNNEEIESEMGDVQKFLKKLIGLYNNCSEKSFNNDFERQWNTYLKIFGKEYTETEKEMRKEIFKKNKEKVEKHNELYEKGSVTYRANLNHLSDWTKEELKKMSGFRPSIQNRKDSGRVARNVEGQISKHFYYDPHLEVNASVDWRTKGGYVNPVKFQGTCASCYAIVGLGSLEAYHKKLSGESVRLSVQNILDCTWHLGNRGCENGFISSVFKYASASGVVSSSLYPYTMNATHNCRWKQEDVVATCEGYYIVQEGSELALQNAVATKGPVAAGIAEAYGDLLNYESGVFVSVNCGPIRHGGLVVGYGTDPIYGDYWIIKNSWGYWWGEDGYFRLARNKHNMCEIATNAFLPY